MKEKGILIIKTTPYDVKVASSSCSGGCSNCGGSCACGTVGTPGSCGK